MSIHTCSYYCDRPECVLAQRDELRQKLEQLEKQEPVAWSEKKQSFYDDVGRLLKAGKGFYDDGTPIDYKEIQLKIEGVGEGVFKCTAVCIPRSPKKEWTHLTDEEFDQVLKEFSHDPRAMAIELEIRIMEKNTCTQP